MFLCMNIFFLSSTFNSIYYLNFVLFVRSLSLLALALWVMAIFFSFTSRVTKDAMCACVRVCKCIIRLILCWHMQMTIANGHISNMCFYVPDWWTLHNWKSVALNTRATLVEWKLTHWLSLRGQSEWKWRTNKTKIVLTLNVFGCSAGRPQAPQRNIWKAACTCTTTTPSTTTNGWTKIEIGNFITRLFNEQKLYTRNINVCIKFLQMFMYLYTRRFESICVSNKQLWGGN